MILCLLRDCGVVIPNPDKNDSTLIPSSGITPSLFPPLGPASLSESDESKTLLRFTSLRLNSLEIFLGNILAVLTTLVIVNCKGSCSPAAGLPDV